MNFDLENYRKAKNRITDLLKATHDPYTEGFIDDGIICPEVYAKQSYRILCILAESYGYDKSGVTDIQDQGKDDVLGLGKGVPTVQRFAIVLYLLQRSLERGSKVSHEEWNAFPRLLNLSPENVQTLQDALAKIAWVNVKKASRPDVTKLNSAEVRDHALRNKEALREQIDAIAPDLIFICGEDAFRSIHALGVLGPNLQLARKWQIQAGLGSQKVLEITHPSYLEWAGYENLYATFERIYDQIV